MAKRMALVMMMLVLCASSALVSAQENTEPLTSVGGYSVEPARDAGGDLKGLLSVYETIVQGQTNWHTKSVSSYITTLNVDLNWGNPGNSLRLKIYSPDGYTFGPFYDSYDGNYDSRINLNINNPGGIAKGTWYYEVYGESVSGTQGYSL
ncbi:MULTISPECIES: peptidase domain-containing protein [unclassified Methanoregula]|uniref:peptidase domain-containing protein n=1 Tax=unclassified Methanoregula TaxID=2649730 RepID=UPI0009D3E4FD|nr:MULTISPECIES: peptidase domain-containing protein [unclassified Methanoregula]OPX65329.1 MAG: hypothetical protein A4E33_00362 [Methanoregula sp. PtaB.Bin085]OPY32238.1 MAG: hypothetical protein A4E34_02612 [Methanoregula sp. PtaU1.Bin006]